MNTKGVLADLASAVIRKQGRQRTPRFFDHGKIISSFRVCSKPAGLISAAWRWLYKFFRKKCPGNWQLATGILRDVFLFFLPSFTTLLAQSLRVSKLSETRLSEDQRQWFSDSIRNARRYWNARKDELCSTDTDSLQWTLFDFHIFPALLTGLQVF